MCPPPGSVGIATTPLSLPVSIPSALKRLTDIVWLAACHACYVSQSLLYGESIECGGE